MLNRKELKLEAKSFVTKAYWKNVLVALLLLAIMNGGLLSSGMSSFSNNSSDSDDRYEEEQEYVSNFIDGFIADEHGLYVDVATIEANSYLSEATNEFFVKATIIFIIIAVVIVLLFFIFMAVFQAFILNPLEVGCKTYFVNALKNNNDLRILAVGYEQNYLKNVKILFLRSLYIFLWSLLLIIPGIIKAYEYMMVPYIIKDHPDMKAKEVFALSREMMTGNKFFAWVLDLSFIGWNILTFLTIGILGVLYVNPYKFLTEANFYSKLKMPLKAEEINDFQTAAIVE